jgi:hypothetical protein
MTMQLTRLRPLALGALAIAVAGGCGDPALGAVTGTVRVGPTPLRAGVIRFHGPDGRLVSGSVNDGGFDLAGISPGTNRVTVVSLPVLEGFTWINPEEPRDPATLPARAPQPKLVSQAIPTRFAAEESSPLSCEIRRGPQAIEVRLD